MRTRESALPCARAHISVFALFALTIALISCGISCLGARSFAFADEKTDAPTGASCTTQAEDAAFYAVLYPDGKLVFQKAQPSADQFTKCYVGNLDGYNGIKYVPWLESAGDITSVEFAEDFGALQPLSLKCWFTGCSNLKIIDLANLDASKSTTMEKLFKGCSALTTIAGLQSFDTTSSTYFGSMFCDCSSLTSLDLSHFDSSHVEVICFMFSGCTRLESLDLSGWANPCMRLTVDVFEGCDNLRVVALGSGFSFHGSGNLKTFRLPDGNWKSSADGCVYDSASIPNNVKATYTRVVADEPGDASATTPADEPGGSSTTPVDEPGDAATTTPADESGNTPTNDSRANNPSKPVAAKGLSKGKTAKCAGSAYLVTSNSKNTVKLVKAAKGKKRFVIPASVVIKGKRYDVTGIDRNAFKGSKAKTIIIKAKAVKAKTVKRCLENNPEVKVVHR